MGKLKRMVTSYKEKDLNRVDRRLIRGLFIKHIRDFDEEVKFKSMNLSLSARFFKEKFGHLKQELISSEDLKPAESDNNDV